jgi:hypothetical protein
MSSSIFVTFCDENKEDDLIFTSLLKQYQSLISSCVGPIKGNFKLITRLNDASSSVLSSSAALLSPVLFDFTNLIKENQKNEMRSQLSFIEWKFDVINSLVKNAHLAHFYDSGLFLYHLIVEFLLKKHSFHLLNFNNKQIIDSIFKNLHNHLNEQLSNSKSFISIPLNLNNVIYLKNLLGTVLSSKY